MTRVLLILLLACAAKGATYGLLWEPADGSVAGYAVLVSTNGGPWRTNAVHSPDRRGWTNNLPAGECKLGVQTLRPGGTNSTHVWSIGFRVPDPKAYEVTSFSGSVKATVMMQPNGTNFFFWVRPSALTNDFQTP